MEHLDCRFRIQKCIHPMKNKIKQNSFYLITQLASKKSTFHIETVAFCFLLCGSPAFTPILQLEGAKSDGRSSFRNGGLGWWRLIGSGGPFSRSKRPIAAFMAITFGSVEQ